MNQHFIFIKNFVNLNFLKFLKFYLCLFNHILLTFINQLNLFEIVIIAIKIIMIIIIIKIIIIVIIIIIIMIMKYFDQIN